MAEKLILSCCLFKHEIVLPLGEINGGFNLVEYICLNSRVFEEYPTFSQGRNTANNNIFSQSWPSGYAFTF